MLEKNVNVFPVMGWVNEGRWCEYERCVMSSSMHGFIAEKFPLVGGGINVSGRVKVRPSKSQSFVGMIGGAVFVIIGFSVMRTMGLFGIIWTVMALAICGLYTYNFFSNRGVASWEIDMDLTKGVANGEGDFEARLRKLTRLKEDGLISENEFEKKRTEIMKSEW